MLGLFKRMKPTIEGPTILLCSIGDGGNAALLLEDKLIYENHYKHIFQHNAANISDFFDFITDKEFDIIHLCAKVEPNGTIEGVFGMELFQYLSNAETKLVIFARNNSSESYVKLYPKVRPSSVKPMNIVMTLNRNDDLFPDFFRSLFDLMAKGDSMPIAWVKLVPQAPGHRHSNTPEMIFLAGLGQLRIIP